MAEVCDFYAPGWGMSTGLRVFGVDLRTLVGTPPGPSPLEKRDRRPIARVAAARRPPAKNFERGERAGRGEPSGSRDLDPGI